MKKIIVQLIITVLLLGCGGGSGNTSTPEISKEKTLLNREVLTIVNTKPKEDCESHEYYNQIAEHNPNFKNILIKSIDENTKTCADYSKDETNCEEFNFEEGSIFCCLIGLDKVTSTEDATQWYDKWYNKDWYFKQWLTEEEIAQLENTAEETALYAWDIYDHFYDQEVQNSIHREQQIQDRINQDELQQDYLDSLTSDDLYYGGPDTYDYYDGY
jgi:hypothetical protein